MDASMFQGLARLDVIGKPLDWTWVVFQEVEMENWGWGGRPVAELTELQAAKAG